MSGKYDGYKKTSYSSLQGGFHNLCDVRRGVVAEKNDSASFIYQIALSM